MKPNSSVTTSKSEKGEKERGIRVSTAEFVAGAARSDQVPATTMFEDAPEIAFAGRSNVGKSSLLNMMLQRKGLARTSNTPGCTRQINFFDIGLAPNEIQPPPPKRIIFVDLPGYGYAKVSKTEGQAWKELLESYLHQRPTLRGVVILVDVRRGLEQEEEDLAEFLEQREGLQIIICATKLDKLPLAQQKPAFAKLKQKQSGGGKQIVATSSETAVGRDQLWGRILEACRVDSATGP